MDVACEKKIFKYILSSMPTFENTQAFFGATQRFSHKKLNRNFATLIVQLAAL